MLCPEEVRAAAARLLSPTPIRGQRVGVQRGRDRRHREDSLSGHGQEGRPDHGATSAYRRGSPKQEA